MPDDSSQPRGGAGQPRVLIAIPAYNEEHTIARVVTDVRAAIPEFDLLVVNDGSKDATEAILLAMGQPVATHLCNLGYGRTVQTAIKYAQRCGYDTLITLDADGQHRPKDVRSVYGDYAAGNCDLLIGSRFITSRQYGSEPAVRRAGMRLFSAVIALLTGRRVYDTSSGMKVISSRAFERLASRPFVDFHAEAIVDLIENGFRVEESPISVEQRTHGTSMYTPISALKYPIKVTFLILLDVVEARIRRGRAGA
jgi:glycosyltransferase involved in cell wall biosynthesis